MNSKNFQINKAKEDLVATLRGLVASELVQVEFDDELENNFFSWNQNLLSPEKKKVVLPQISQSLKHYRAASDMAACYFLFHDQNIHKDVMLNLSKCEIDEFEKIRVLVLVKDFYRGVGKNILRKIEENPPTPPDKGSFSLILLKEFFAEEILPKTRDVISDLEKRLTPKILREIKNLSQKISDQEAFALDVARILEMLQREREKQEKENSPAPEEKSKNDLSSFGAEKIEENPEENFAETKEESVPKKIEKKEKVSGLKEDEKKTESRLKLEESRAEEDQVKFKNPYKIFTSQFDEVVFPQKLVARNELASLRDQLDLRLAKLSTISRKMSLKLKRKLLSKRNLFLEFDSSRGILDRKKLTRLIIDPMIEDIWINSRSHEYQDTALTILLDNSGSMRGNPIVMSALACEIIAQILEKFSVKTEIIGFTTADWKGGRARKLWESSGRAKNPGRLNELRHIIYKHFNQSFKKAKINLGLMLKEGVLKENIDGEALLFARSRLMQQSEKRKILLVISDGTPVDDSTLAANDSDILSEHLRHVINKIEKAGKLEIVGIGIGHTTEEFYRNSITIKNVEELGDVMIEKISELL